MMRPAPRQRQ